MRSTAASTVVLLGIVFLLGMTSCRGRQEDDMGSAKGIGDPDGKTAVATFGGGCFWCTEAVYQALQGVDRVESGYSGGRTENPTYYQIGTGMTGHAEVVQIHYDPELVKFTQLLEVFFATHDPTTLNRQGADVGTQYRSIVLYHDDVQKKATEKVIAALEASGAFDAPIVTQVQPFERFWPAEDEHQDYYASNPNQPYCRALIPPKLEKLKKVFGDLVE